MHAYLRKKEWSESSWDNFESNYQITLKVVKKVFVTVWDVLKKESRKQSFIDRVVNVIRKLIDEGERIAILINGPWKRALKTNLNDRYLFKIIVPIYITGIF